MTPGVRVHVVMPRELVAEIDRVKHEGQSRGDWVRRAVERALDEQATSGENPVRRGVPIASGAPGPAPAEQPDPIPGQTTVDEQIAESGPVSNFDRLQGVDRSAAFRRATQK